MSGKKPGCPLPRTIGSPTTTWQREPDNTVHSRARKGHSNVSTSPERPLQHFPARPGRVGPHRPTRPPPAPHASGKAKGRGKPRAASPFPRGPSAFRFRDGRGLTPLPATASPPPRVARPSACARRRSTSSTRSRKKRGRSSGSRSRNGRRVAQRRNRHCGLARRRARICCGSLRTGGLGQRGGCCAWRICLLIRRFHRQADRLRRKHDSRHTRGVKGD